LTQSKYKGSQRKQTQHASFELIGIRQSLHFGSTYWARLTMRVNESTCFCVHVGVTESNFTPCFLWIRHWGARFGAGVAFFGLAAERERLFSSLLASDLIPMWNFCCDVGGADSAIRLWALWLWRDGRFSWIGDALGLGLDRFLGCCCSEVRGAAGSGPD
jgi:hypothetical protein